MGDMGARGNVRSVQPRAVDGTHSAAGCEWRVPLRCSPCVWQGSPHSEKGANSYLAVCNGDKVPGLCVQD